MTAAHRIGPKEDALLALLGRYVRVTAEQATRHSYSPNSIRHVRNALNSMIELGHVDCYRGFSRGGNPPIVYSPSMKGWRYLEDHHGMPIPTRWKPSEVPRAEYADFRHDVGITDTGIAIERFCRAATPYVTFVQFQHDRFLPQTKVPLLDGTRPAMRLDGFVELHVRRDDSGRKKQRCHLIEYDRGTHYKAAVRKKFQLQLRYVQDGHYQRDFETESVSYLWICPTGQERVKYLRTQLEAVLQEEHATDYAWIFLFTAADPATIDPFDFFTKPSWTAPFSDDPITLLTFPAAEKRLRVDQSQYLPQDAYDQFLRANGDDVQRIAGEMDLA